MKVRRVSLNLDISLMKCHNHYNLKYKNWGLSRIAQVNV